MNIGVTRREWMLAAACWADVLRGQTAKPQFKHFDLQTSAEVEALSAQIIPEDGTPGARTAGVIWFIDGALAGYDEDKRGIYTRGLAEAQAKREALFPKSTSIAALNADQQIAVLKSIESTEFFSTLR